MLAGVYVNVPIYCSLHLVPLRTSQTQIKIRELIPQTCYHIGDS